MTRQVALLALLLSLAHADVFCILTCANAGDPPRVARVGFVNPHSPSSAPAGTNAFKERLRELGYIEGQNLVVDAGWASGQADRLPTLVADVLGRKPDVLVTWGAVATLAARNATSSVPLIGVGDLMGAGLVPTLARPQGNLTGVSLGFSNIATKWLELLKETVPRLSTVAVVVNPENPLPRRLAGELERAAAAQRLTVRFIEARTSDDLVAAFEQAQRQADAVLVLPDPVLYASQPRIVALAAKHRLPSIYPVRETAVVGGLMSYGPSFAATWRRTADYVDRILKGAKPADLPIEEPSQYELVVNLRTAKALGLTVPRSVLARADEVVQ